MPGRRTPLRFPEGFSWRPPPLTPLPAGTPLYRVQPAGGRLLHYGRDEAGENRWNPPPDRHPAFGVWYAACAPTAALTETLLQNLECAVVSWSAIRERELLEVRLDWDLTVIDLSGTALSALHADGKLLVTDDLRYPRAWAHALHLRANAQGLLYPARTLPRERALALFEPAGTDVLSAAARRTALPDLTLPGAPRMRNLIEWLEQEFDVSVKDDTA